MRKIPCSSCAAMRRMMPENSDPSILCPVCGPVAGTPPSDSMRNPIKLQCNVRDDDDDDDNDDEEKRPRKRKSSGGSGAAAAGAAAGVAGIGIGMILLIVFGLVACCLCVPGILVALLVPAVQKVREAAARVQTVNNMRQIALAAQSFNDQNKHAPSPQMQPVNFGMPAPDLSWRVSILPFVEQKGLFDRFDKSKSWNDPKNQPLLKPMPFTYKTATDVDPQQTQTTFQYFTGPNTLFPTSLTKTSLNNIPDGASNTLLVGESAVSQPWSKVADMNVTPNGALPMKAGVFIAAMADGSARPLDRGKISDDVLRQLIDPRDNKVLPAGWDH